MSQRLKDGLALAAIGLIIIAGGAYLAIPEFVVAGFVTFVFGMLVVFTAGA